MALPSIRSVVDRGGRLILMSHLGRPKGEGIEAGLSMQPVAERLSELLAGVPVHFPGDMCDGEESRKMVEGMGEGEVVLLENLRFHAGEKQGDEGFAGRLAELADLYVNDAFGTAHRSDASMVAVPGAMKGKPRVAGLLLERELRYLSEAIEHAETPFVAVLGGAKVSDKLPALKNLLNRVDGILVGGAMAYTFLKAKGFEVGGSRVEEDMLEEAREILEGAGGSGATIHLPVDHVCGRGLESGTETVTVSDSIPQEFMGLDIGPETRESYRRVLLDAKTIIWNGPMGVFEIPPFDAGTRGVAEAMVDATGNGAMTIVGGGDSAAAAAVLGLEKGFSHISSGGGASLQMLEGKQFASVLLLDQVVSMVPDG